MASLNLRDLDDQTESFVPKRRNRHHMPTSAISHKWFSFFAENDITLSDEIHRKLCTIFEEGFTCNPHLEIIYIPLLTSEDSIETKSLHELECDLKYIQCMSSSRGCYLQLVQNYIDLSVENMCSWIKSWNTTGELSHVNEFDYELDSFLDFMEQRAIITQGYENSFVFRGKRYPGSIELTKRIMMFLNRPNGS